MSLSLRPYQTQLKEGIYDAWRSGNRNVLGVAPTGSGKTAIFSSIFADMAGSPSVAIAHRQELVSQMSLALARCGVYHNIIAAPATVKFCIQQHMKVFGKNFHHASSPVAASGVQTLIRRSSQLTQWANACRMWVQDEAHHVLPDNSWRKAAELFPNAIGLGVTASPVRCDRKPLGRMHGGLFDKMVIGPSMRELISMGFLADYRIYAPPESINLAKVQTSKLTGDYNQDSLRKEAHESTITGDIVEHYVRLAAGKRGITFTVDVDQAMEVAKRYNAAGVPADAVSAKTPDHIRQNSIDKFSRGEILQLVNVDLFGEGFDVPAVEVVSMGRPTQSFGLYLQQFGRALRPSNGKSHGILLDHVGNVKRHGLPDAVRHWTLQQEIKGVTTRRVEDDVIPVTTCLECFAAYEAVTNKCPYCGAVKTPESRGSPEFVDGDLVEFSPELLAKLRGEIARVAEGKPSIPYGATTPIVKQLENLWVERQTALKELHDAIDLWGGIQTQIHERTESEAYRVFYHTFGVDVLTAQTLPREKMINLTNQIRSTF